MVRGPVSWVVRRLSLVGVALMTFGVPAMAQPASLFDRILANPDDPTLNMRYAELMLAQGNMRHALAAYERALATDPHNREIRRAYKRVKRLLLPNVTTVTVDTGVTYTSNPRQLPSSRRRESDVVWDVRLFVFDERTVLNHRWRTEATASTKLQSDVSDLNEGELSVWTGPVLQVGSDARLHLALGGGVAFLDGRYLYGDAIGRVTFEWLRNGLAQTLSTRIAYRETDSAFRGSDGVIVDLTGQLMALPKLIRGDALYIQPRLRYSGPTGSGPGRVFSRPLFPGDFFEAGNRVSYYFPLHRGKIYLGVGTGVFYRDYEQNVAFATNKRHDWFIEPTAHMVLPHLLKSDFDLRVDYRFEHNDSNDRLEDFENHVVGVRAVRRF